MQCCFIDFLFADGSTSLTHISFALRSSSVALRDPLDATFFDDIASEKQHESREGLEMEMVTNLIIQLISGVVGGNAAGAALKDYNLGNLGNTIAGAIGGVGGGQILQALVPAIASAAGGELDLGAIVGQIVVGGAGGAILTVIAGLVKSMMASQQTR